MNNTVENVQAVSVKFSQDLKHDKSLKSVNFWESYLKNKKVDVFLGTRRTAKRHIADYHRGGAIKRRTPTTRSLFNCEGRPPANVCILGSYDFFSTVTLTLTLWSWNTNMTRPRYCEDVPAHQKWSLLLFLFFTSRQSKVIVRTRQTDTQMRPSALSAAFAGGNL